ncbi:MAG: hypothetical protein ACAI44_14640 [Candidatus Sericytochromatia bacterium]
MTFIHRMGQWLGSWISLEGSLSQCLTPGQDSPAMAGSEMLQALLSLERR